MPNVTPRTVVCSDDHAFASTGAGLIAQALLDAIHSNGRASIALAGGSTPGAAYRRLATLALPWNDIDFFFGDERAVPPSDHHANHRAIGKALFEPAGVPAGNVHRPESDALDLDAAATAYEDVIRAAVPTRSTDPIPHLDLVLLGMGGDGHTASLFPRQPAVDEEVRLFVATGGGDPVDRRLTMTFPLINGADRVIVLATGEKKAALVRSVLHRSAEAEALPISRVAPVRGELAWLLDAAAASQL